MPSYIELFLAGFAAGTGVAAGVLFLSVLLEEQATRATKLHKTITILHFIAKTPSNDVMGVF